ncbi:Proton-dependent oligopeptide transporter family protein [Dioscorea alata]|uniref:Proton-dependent oligopeptide transporter family protein n=2 Tax=Dioscorea alata TaxID=55571 RepID=A0ACB7VRY1_DIOAL|nr:Proton-dependent oligopeptide transporter family protein [Dioscorea alata]KAH7677226.1 Proton-dependent oligopeptide transporter family protein [Dioscorea alata]
MAEENGSEGREAKKTSKGGFKSMPFILATELCDRIATSGLNANLISYLTKEMHMPLVIATNTVTITKGTSSFTPIIGGLISDSFAGCFWTITVGSIFYLLGLAILTISAILPMLHPPSCSGDEKCKQASTWQLILLYFSLFLTTIGSGGIRPCVAAFGADQFNHAGANMEAKKRTFFNLYFFCLRLATGIALIVVVYVQENVGWGWGLNIPTITMLISIIIFVFGYSLYIKSEPKGSPLTRLAQVVVAAIKKRKVDGPIDAKLLYEDKELDASISTTGLLRHTDKIRCLDRAAIVMEGDKTDTGKPNPWRLSTVHRVEELKSLIHITPIWAVGIFFIATASNIGTFAILQARTMDRRLGHLKIPPATMSIFLDISTILTLAFYDRIFVPIARRITGRPSGITSLQRMIIGVVISMLCYVVAALAEIKRKSVAKEYGLLDKPKAVIPVSVFWVAPQYIVYGMAEAFLSVGQMEFLYDQAPESMRSIAVALYWLAIAIGDYVSSGIVALVNKCSKNHGDWLQDNINRGKLDYYWWLMTGLEFLNLIYLIICAKFYTYKRLEMLVPEISSNAVTDERDDGYTELRDGNEHRSQEEANRLNKLHGEQQLEAEEIPLLCS